MMQRINCEICGSESSFFITKNKHNLYKCVSCKLIFVSPMPTNTEYIYGKTYFKGHDKKFGYVEYDRDKQAMKSVFLKYLQIIDKYLGGKRGNLLDIGSATGFFMKLAKDFGWSAEGIDISPWASLIGKKEGLRIHRGSLEAGTFSEKHFDVATLFDVFEHFIFPRNMLKNVNLILKKGGLLVINTPDSNSYWARILGRYWQALVPPEHLYLFNQNNIKILLEEYGFQVLEVRKVGKKFTLEYILYTLLGKPGLFDKSWMNKIPIPLDVRDNILIISQKAYDV